MCFRSPSRLVALVALVAMLPLGAVAQSGHHRGRKYKAPPPVSRVDVLVLRSDDGTPVENASVIFQLVDDKGNMELKTDQDGKAFIDVLPTGSKFLLQILAKGYQTFGQAYDLEKKEMAIEVTLNRPGHQYSIYDEHASDTRVGGTARVVTGKSAEEKLDADAEKAAAKENGGNEVNTPAPASNTTDAKPDPQTDSKPQE
ncbi:MAG: carboxypeptidase regulatory-like domain-containing protein [Acidobacteriota bacterium]|nr:carboxypeptidase regulatory-like domain-containing protein [Acidobacteriota bacterium]